MFFVFQNKSIMRKKHFLPYIYIIINKMQCLVLKLKTAHFGGLRFQINSIVPISALA